jgi:hypothetical protein
MRRRWSTSSRRARHGSVQFAPCHPRKKSPRNESSSACPAAWTRPSPRCC